jgi:ABC-type lipoprotein release transport system permease subunit
MLFGTVLSIAMTCNVQLSHSNIDVMAAYHYTFPCVAPFYLHDCPVTDRITPPRIFGTVFVLMVRPYVVFSVSGFIPTYRIAELPDYQEYGGCAKQADPG